jgi:hypothetical protein
MAKFENSWGIQRENIGSASPVWIPQLFSNLVILHILAYEDGTECSETSAYKIQKPVNCPEENIQHTEHGESLKFVVHTKIYIYIYLFFFL